MDARGPELVCAQDEHLVDEECGQAATTPAADGKPGRTTRPVCDGGPGPGDARYVHAHALGGVGGVLLVPRPPLQSELADVRLEASRMFHHLLSLWPGHQLRAAARVTTA